VISNLTHMSKAQGEEWLSHLLHKKSIVTYMALGKVFCVIL